MLEAFFAFVNCIINKKKTEYTNIRKARVSRALDCDHFLYIRGAPIDRLPIIIGR